MGSISATPRREWKLGRWQAPNLFSLRPLSSSQRLLTGLFLPSYFPLPFWWWLLCATSVLPLPSPFWKSLFLTSSVISPRFTCWGRDEGKEEIISYYPLVISEGRPRRAPHSCSEEQRQLRVAAKWPVDTFCLQGALTSLLLAHQPC